MRLLQSVLAGLAIAAIAAALLVIYMFTTLWLEVEKSSGAVTAVAGGTSEFAIPFVGLMFVAGFVWRFRR